MTKYLIAVALIATLGSLVVTGAILGWSPQRIQGESNTEIALGLSRYEWIDIHLFFAVCIVVLLTLHLCTNVTWLFAATKQYFKTHWIGALSFFVWSWIILLVFAWSIASLKACGNPTSYVIFPIERLCQW